ncbi:MAG: substrate-binding domain-containing protein, partial [Fibrobacteres bacterium]|nr:substrate-binding domain-containing protein [Fibrobacterota bacterium]
MKAGVAKFVAVAVLFGFTLLLAEEPILCYVGGTMRPAMEELVKTYEAKTGKKVLVDYSGSGELIVKIKQTKKGDLFVAHDPFHAQVMKEGLGVKGWMIASVVPVIVVQKGNPK